VSFNFGGWLFCDEVKGPESSSLGVKARMGLGELSQSHTARWDDVSSSTDLTPRLHSENVGCTHKVLYGTTGSVRLVCQ